MTSLRDEIPAELLRFIHGCIDSVEQLQILLLLVERPQDEWSAEKLSLELRSSLSSVQKRLQDLRTRKVLSPAAFSADGMVRYIPFSAETGIIVQNLVELNRQRPHRVIAQIYNKPPAAIQSFADAFKFKKEED